MGHPEAADEPRFQSADRNFVMSAWGGTTRDHPAKVIAAQWNSAQRQAGREITYQRRGQTWFVVSGTDRRGIEFYEKFTMRGQQVAFLDITFPRSLMARYEGWVEQIENGFRPVALRGGISELPPVNRRQPAESARERTPEPLKRSPEPAPIAPEPKLTQRPPKKSPDVKVAPSSDESLPSAEKVAGKSGFVYSPFSADKRIVDVTDVPSGTKVKCPYTMKIFRVP